AGRLLGVRTSRTGAGSAPAVWHRKQRPCLAAFALLAGVAYRTQGRGDRGTGADGNRSTEDASMTGKRSAKETQRARFELRRPTRSDDVSPIAGARVASPTVLDAGRSPTAPCGPHEFTGREETNQ